MCVCADVLGLPNARSKLQLYVQFAVESKKYYLKNKNSKSEVMEYPYYIMRPHSNRETRYTNYHSNGDNYVIDLRRIT